MLPPAVDVDLKPVGVTDQEFKEVHEMGYRNLVGELLWPSRNTAPGIAAGIGLLSKCVHRPSWGAWYSALHLLHFLYANRHAGIQFRSDGNLEPACYYDSGFYQDLIGHKPQYGFVVFWAGGPLIWRSKKHSHIPLNTSEAEYMALCNAWRHVKWLRNVLTAMGFGWMVAKATRIIGDNQNATNWAVEKMISDGNRHIDIMYMKIRERVAMGEIAPEWIKGKINSSDLLTKVVKKDVVDALLKTLQGLEPIDGITTRNVKELGDARSLLSAATSAEMANHVCGMVFDRFDDRTFDPSEVMDFKRPGDVKTTALNRPALLAAMAHYPPAPITPLARY